jgi:hypothetical protein
MGVTLSHHHGMPLLRLIRPGCYEHWCSGCAAPHRLEIGARMPSGQRLGFDGDIYRPSFEPEIVHEDGDRVCRYLLRGGRLHFAADCTHALAGQSVELPDFPAHH